MNRTSCIAFRPNSPNIVIRRDFLDICESKHCVALVLSQMMYWHEVKVAHRSQAYAANRQARATGKPADQHTDVWVWKKQAELKTEIFGTHGERAIADALAYLVDRGFLSERRNPYNQYDRTLQYRFEVEAVQGAVDALARLAPEIEIVDDGDAPPVAPRLRAKPKNEGAEMRSHLETAKASMNETAEVQAQKTAPIRGYENAEMRQCDRSFAATYSQFCGISKITSEITNPKTTTTDHTPAAKKDDKPVEDVNVHVVVSDCVNTPIGDSLSVTENAPEPKTESEIPNQVALIEKLISLGITPSTAARLVQDYPDRIENQIAYLLHRPNAQNKQGTLIRAIEGDWGVPDSYAPPQKPRKAPVVASMGLPFADKLSGRFGQKAGLFTPPATDILWQELSDLEKRQIENQAMDAARANPVLRNRLEKIEREGGGGEGMARVLAGERRKILEKMIEAKA